MTPEERAKAIVNAVNAGYADETFVSEGYGYFDDMTAAIAQALRETAEQARREENEAIAQLMEPHKPNCRRWECGNCVRASAIRSRIAKNDEEPQ